MSGRFSLFSMDLDTPVASEPTPQVSNERTCCCMSMSCMLPWNRLTKAAGSR
jgi:hypothetical protein